MSALRASSGVRPRAARTRRRALVIGLLSAAAGCAGDSEGEAPNRAGAANEGACPSGLPSNAACSTQAPSYRLEVAAIVEQRCATCHFPGNLQSSDVFVDHDDLFATRQTVLTRIYTCVMPPEGAPALTPEERRVLLQWFVCGAPDN